MQKLVFLTAVMLFSCGIDIADKEQDPQNPTERTQEQGDDVPAPVPFFADMLERYGPVIEGAIFKKPLLVGEAKEGDRILLRLSARRMVPDIGDEEIVSFDSHHLFEDCPTVDHYNNNQCSMEHQEGVCEVRYRQYHGLEKEPLNFLDQSKIPQIQIAIGENRYQLEKVIRREEFFMVMEFNIAPAMVSRTESNRLILHPPTVDKNAVETVKSGFMGFQKCPTHTEYGFTCDGCQRRQEHPGETIEYTLDVIVQPNNPS